MPPHIGLPWDWLPGNQVWPHAGNMANGGIRNADGDAPDDTPREKFRELSPRCWSIWQCHEECRSNLGLDRFEGRSWKRLAPACHDRLRPPSFLQPAKSKFPVDVGQLSGQAQVICQETGGPRVIQAGPWYLAGGGLLRVRDSYADVATNLSSHELGIDWR
jgi:hypothetical protein